MNEEITCFIKGDMCCGETVKRILVSYLLPQFSRSSRRKYTNSSSCCRYYEGWAQVTWGFKKRKLRFCLRKGSRDGAFDKCLKLTELTFLLYTSGTTLPTSPG